MRGVRLAFVAASVLLVVGLVALSWARRGSERTPVPSQSPVAEAPAPVPPPDGIAEAAGRKLVVTVRDALSGAPLAGAAVVATPWNGARTQAPTDAEGRAEIAPLWGKVTASHRGHAPQCERVGPAMSQLIFLLRPGPAVRGRVVRAGSGKGIEGASVVVTEIDASDTVEELVTGAEGRFEVPSLAPDAPFLLVAQLPGVPPVGRVERRPDPDREIVLELGGGAVLEGRVIRPDGAGAAGAKVRVGPRGGEPLIPEDLPFGIPDYEVETCTDDNGAFRIEGLRVPAIYAITAEDERLSTGRADDVEFRDDGQTAWREIRLTSKTTVHVRVEVPPGVSWPYPGLALRQGGKDVCPQCGRVAEDGHTFETRTSGPHEILAFHSGWPTARVPIDVREGPNELVVRMTFEGHRVVSGRVLAENGAPLGGTEITASCGGHLDYPAEDGSFLVCDVPDAPGTLEVRDETGVHLPWSKPGVAPGTRLEVVLHPAGGFVGRIEPVPATRRIVVHRINRHHRFKEYYEVGDWLVSTDDDGAFRIAWSPGRPVSLAFDPPDAAPLLRDEAALAEGEFRDLGTLHLEPGRSAEGRVVDDVGNPVADCRLKLEMRFGPGGGTMVILSGTDIEDRHAYTTADGRFRFSRLPEAPLSLEATADGFVPRTLDLPGIDALQALEFRLVRAGFVEGVLANAGGRPIAGETVEFACPGRDEPFWGSTDSLGRFRVAVAPGTCRLKHDEHEGPSVEVRAGETTRIDFRLGE